MHVTLALALLVAGALLGRSAAYSGFRDLIPNGMKVPNPCGGRWRGVGHYSKDGGGRLNPFGQDFQRFSERWTEGLCRMDSDGDGKTNGEELGDPDCVWSTGQDPMFPPQSHPGVTEPVGEDFCDL